MQTHANAQIAQRSFGFAHFLELRPSCGKVRPSSGKLRSSCGFVFSRALHQAARQPLKVPELDLSRKKTLECQTLSGALVCVSKGPPGRERGTRNCARKFFAEPLRGLFLKVIQPSLQNRVTPTQSTSPSAAHARPSSGPRASYAELRTAPGALTGQTDSSKDCPQGQLSGTEHMRTSCSYFHKQPLDSNAW